jgi:hypothetical protein
MPHFEMICLANSKKLGGHCVAGLRLDGSGWIRPVGVLPDGILWPSDYTLTNGREAKTLDVIRVGLRSPRPAAHQPENWVIDGSCWALCTCSTTKTCLAILRKAIVAGPELLTGVADRIPFAQFQKEPAAASLALVAPEDLYVYDHLRRGGRRQARGRFSLGTGDRLTLYDLPITEPHWQRTILNGSPHTLRQAEGKFLLTISLSEPFAEKCYKLIAAIMPLPRHLAAEF